MTPTTTTTGNRTASRRRPNRAGSPSRAGSRASSPNGRSRNGTGPDAIKLLKDEHRSVERLFRDFEKSGPTAYKSRRKLVEQMVAELSQHAAIEEEVLYPAARQIADIGDEVLEALEEHHLVKLQLNELQAMDPSEERFSAKVRLLIENVRYHVEEEEGELFPVLRSELGRKRLVELGEELSRARRFAPTRPHPRSPDERPGNLLPNTVAGAMDRARDRIRSTRQGS